MAFCGCNDRWTCPAIAVVVSALVGVVTAFLQITAVITVAPLFFQAVIAITVLLLAVTLFSAAATNDDSCHICVCRALKAQLLGILGSILTALVLLAVGFAATSTLGAAIPMTTRFIAMLDAPSTKR